MIAQILRKFSPRVSARMFGRLMNLWPPFIGAGIRVVSISTDFRSIQVKLLRRWYNSNYVGTQFGGSIFAMTDPFYMLMLINNLGTDYIVWDMAASVRFRKPGKTHLFANFVIDDLLLEKIRQTLLQQDKFIFDLPIDVVDVNGLTIAEVTKTIYIKRK